MNQGSEIKLGIIGVGNMGYAIIKALLKKKITKKSNIFALDSNPDKIDSLGIRKANSIPDLLKKISIGSGVDDQRMISALLLAVKPQQFQDLVKDLKGKIDQRTIVISIMAGISTHTLTKSLRHFSIIRAIPNTPTLLGEGMTVWLANHHENPSIKRIMVQLFSAFGRQLEVKKEALIDAATALSGSGPAYMFALTEAWIAAAENLGFSSSEAKLLVQQTLKGALKLMSESSDSPKTLQEKVTSKGGTTEAALKHLKTKNWSKAFQDAIEKAYQRAKELGK